MEGEFAVVGLSYLTAAVDVREALSRKSSQTDALSALLKRDLGLDVVVLSTCSRFEVYAHVTDESLAGVLAWLDRRAGRALAGNLYIRRGPEALRHLFRVTGGLDSWVVGETEILGQVKAAYHDACVAETVGRCAHLAFQRALFVGKKVRNETRIVGGVNSIGGAATLLAQRIFKDLRAKRVLIFGAGAMAASTVRHLCAKGAGEIRVANRSLDHAQALAAELGGSAVSLSDGLSLLAEADIAVFSTGSETYLLDRAAAAELSAKRRGRPLFLIDISVPRNVDPAVADAPGLYVYDIDHLQRVISEATARREQDLADAEAIVSSETAEFWRRLSAPPEQWPRPDAGREAMASSPR